MLNTLKMLRIFLKVLILTTVTASDTSLEDLEDGTLLNTLAKQNIHNIPNAPGMPTLKKHHFPYQLEWKSPQVHTSQVTSYRLEGYIIQNNYKQGNQTNEQWHLYYEGEDNYWLIDKKEMNQKYYFRVRAKNVYGSGEWSNSSIVDLTESTETLTMPYFLPILIFIVTSLIVVIIIVYYFYCPCRQRNISNRENITPPIMTDNEQETTSNRTSPLVNILDVPRLQDNQLHLQMEDIPNVFKWQDELNTIGLYTIIIKKEQITRTLFLGEGKFGQVFQGIVRNLEGSGIKSVAIEMLEENVPLKEKKKFLQEAKLMSQFRDKHVLRLLGICIDRDSPWLVIELMEGGDLLQYLRESRTLQSSDARALRLQDLLAMCEDVARGCCYLEDLRFVHRDLACRNCLISTRNRENRIVKIADFGLTKNIYQNDYYRMREEGLLPVRWMAPESLKDKIFTLKTDVWAFGVLIWEIMSLGEQPYSDRSNSEVIRYVREGGKLSKPLNCPLALYQLMQHCWDAANKRPTFKSCLENIVTLRNNIEDAILIVNSWDTITAEN